MSAPQITRREFLETAGVAGLVIGFHLPATGRQAMRGGAAAAFAPNAWLRIGADESVLVVVDRSEMGQGVTTSLRSEEHTSELQSRGHLVCRLLLEKKKKTAPITSLSTV